MDTIIITFKELDRFIHETFKNGADPISEAESVRLLDYNLLKDTEFTISEYLRETKNWDVLNNEYLTVSPNEETITINHPDLSENFINTLLLFDNLMKFSDWIFHSYENQLLPWVNDAWASDYCHGDDDVDYNSSYLDFVQMTIELYLLKRTILQSNVTLTIFISKL